MRKVQPLTTKPAQDKTIKVFDTEGHFLSYCTPKRAGQMTFRKKAEWRGLGEVTLLYSKRDAQALYREVLERDGPNCYICGEELPLGQITYDHIIPRQRGGKDELSNLAVCCPDCNVEKGNQTFNEYVLTLYARLYILREGYTFLSPPPSMATEIRKRRYKERWEAIAYTSAKR